MSDDVDKKILRRLVEKDLIDLESLIEKGVVEERAIDIMMSELLAEEPKRTSQAKDEEADHSPLQSAGAPNMKEVPQRNEKTLNSSPSVFRHYESLKFLREGGMEELRKEGMSWGALAPEPTAPHGVPPVSIAYIATPSPPLVYEASQQRAVVQKRGFPQSTAAPKKAPECFGRFRNLSDRKEGGMGYVYRAYDPLLNRYVALKLLKISDPELTHRLLREAQSQAQIDHPNVCRIHEAGDLDGKAYIAMQYIDGGTLRDLAPDLTFQEKVTVMKQVAEALAEAHRLSIIHRDIKPANIMLDRKRGEIIPYIVDFGLAREVAASGFTMTDMVVGTPWYMSPEQALGKIHSLDARSDIYSFGVTLYEILSGSLPYDQDSDLSILQKVIGSDAIPLDKKTPTIDADLVTITMKCLEKEPSRRYQTAKELAEDLDRFCAGDPVLARRPSLWYLFFRFATKHRKSILYGGALFLVAGAILFLKGGVGLVGIWILFALAATVFASERLRLYRRHRAQQEASIRFAFQVKEIEKIALLSYRSPLHDVRPDQDRVRSQMRQIADTMAAVGSVAVGPANYALGFGCMMLVDYLAAISYLTTAWNAGYDTAECAYQLMLAYSALYSQHLEEAQRAGDLEVAQRLRKDAEEKYRKPAFRYLSRASVIKLDAPEYAEALIAFGTCQWFETQRSINLASKASNEGSRRHSSFPPERANLVLVVGQTQIRHVTSMMRYVDFHERIVLEVIRSGCTILLELIR